MKHLKKLFKVYFTKSFMYDLKKGAIKGILQDTFQGALYGHLVLKGALQEEVHKLSTLRTFQKVLESACGTANALEALAVPLPRSILLFGRLFCLGTFFNVEKQILAIKFQYCEFFCQLSLQLRFGSCSILIDLY